MASSPLPGPNDILLASPSSAFQPDALSQSRPGHANLKPNQVGQVILYGIPIVSLVIDGQERLCLAQISNTLLKNFSYNEIHNRRVALGITCVQCTPVQLEILRRAGAMPISSRRCGMITKREAERLCKSFLGENRPPKLPDNFAFDVSHECAWGCRGSFIPARYNSSRAKCIKCSYCNMYFSPNKFIFHSHRTPDAKYTQPDAANFNSWRRHLKLTDKSPQDELVFAWEDVKAMFNGGSRKRALPQPSAHPACHPLSSVKAAAVAAAAAVAGGGGLLGPHLLGAPPPPPPPPPLAELAGAPHAHHKRPRFDDDDDSLQEAAVVAAASLSAAAASLSVAAATGGAGPGAGGPGGGCVAGVGVGASAGAGAAAGTKGPRSYPVIPVPSKGSFGGVLQKFPGCGGLFPHPYTFPAAAAAFGLCHKKEDAGTAAEALGGAGAGSAGAAPKAGLSGLFWPAGRKDAFYPPFCMFWPPRTPGGLPVPTYLQPPPQPPSALGCALGDSPALLRQAFLDLAEPGGAGGSAEAAPPPGQPPPVVANGPGSGPPATGGTGARDTLFESPPGGSGGDCSAGSTPPAEAGVTSGTGAASSGAGSVGARVPAPHHPHLLEGRKAGGGSYHHSSAFRPVGGKDDAESLAKLHGASAGAPHSAPAHHHHHHHHPHHHHHHPPQPPSPLLLLQPQPDEPGSERHHPAPPPPPPPPPLAPQPHHRGLLSPEGTSCSYPSEDSSEDEEDEEEEQEVDVEGHKPLEGEEEEDGRDPEEEEEEDEETRVLLGDSLVGGGRFLQGRGLSEKGSGRDRTTPAVGAFPLALNSSRLLQEDGKLGDPGGSDLPAPPPPPLALQKASSSGGSRPSSPVHHPSLEEEPSYKDNQKPKENNQVTISTKDDNFSDKNKGHSFFIADSDSSGDFWRERSGGHTQEASSPHSLKKDVENMGKEELQKVLFEQIDLRRRLEQEFQVLKGNASFPVFNNFQDQMKRELAYREEMVQQLQIIPYAASLIRKEKLGAHLSKS